MSGIVHPFVDDLLAYRLKVNTANIKGIFEHEAESDLFFVFTNYMDTHDPYYPPWEFHSEQVADLDWGKVKRINDGLNS